MNKCPECLTTGVGWNNAVPICEMDGVRSFDKGYCPHCGSYCHPYLNLDYTKLPSDSKFKVAGKGTYFIKNEKRMPPYEEV